MRFYDTPVIQTMRQAARFVFRTLSLIMPLIYLAYMHQLETLKCACATTHELFPRLKLLTIAMFALMLASEFVVALVGKKLLKFAKLGITCLLVVAFLVWFADMQKLRCECSDRWQKYLWFVTTCLNALALVFGLVALVLKR